MKRLATALLATFSVPALACSFSAESVDLTVAIKRDRSVQVFYGTVLDVRSAALGDGTAYTSIVAIDEPIHGTGRRLVTLESEVTTDPSGCFDAFNFSADKGDRVFIVATSQKGRDAYSVNGYLSVRLTHNGKVIADVDRCKNLKNTEGISPIVLTQYCLRSASQTYWRSQRQTRAKTGGTSHQSSAAIVPTSFSNNTSS